MEPGEAAAYVDTVSPDEVKPMDQARRSDFGSNGSGMGPNPPHIQLPNKTPEQDFDYKEVSDCMKQHSLAPLGGNVYMDPGDVF